MFHPLFKLYWDIYKPKPEESENNQDSNLKTGCCCCSAAKNFVRWISPSKHLWLGVHHMENLNVSFSEKASYPIVYHLYCIYKHTFSQILLKIFLIHLKVQKTKWQHCTPCNNIYLLPRVNKCFKCCHICFRLNKMSDHLEIAFVYLWSCFSHSLSGNNKHYENWCVSIFSFFFFF